MNTILASEKAFELADTLEQKGFHEISESIRVSIYGGATGLEIAFRLKDSLRSIRKNKIPDHLFKKVLEIESILKQIH